MSAMAGATEAALESVAAALLAPGRRGVAVLIGAGASVAAGIPDFRSPGGMYDTLRPELLTATEEERQFMRDEPVAVVDWRLFSRNSLPYLEVRRPFILGLQEGKWRPTLAHFFLKELEERGLLRRVYSQNIDGLEFLTGLGKGTVVTCHGTLGTASCERCGEDVDMDWFVHSLRTQVKDIYPTADPAAPAESTPIACPACAAPAVKPSTVLYGRSLPSDFFDAVEDDFPEHVDTILVVGTSLTVGPANTVPCMASDSALRVVVNMEPVGAPLGIEYAPDAQQHAASQVGRDVFLPGPCDASLAVLAKRLGWAEGMLAKFGDKMAVASLETLKRAIAPTEPVAAKEDASKQG